MRGTLQTGRTSIGNADIRLRAPRTQAHASPQGRQRRTHAGTLDRGREILCEACRKLDDVGLSSAASKAPVNQREKPLREVLVQRRTLLAA